MAHSRFPKSGDRDDGLLRWAPRVLAIALVCLGAWLATEWFWYFMGDDSGSAPSAAPARQPVDIRAQAETVASARLFGADKPVATVAQVSTLNIKLKGVFAGAPDRPAFAIVNTGGRDDFTLTGREVMPGVKLEEVHATHVLVSRGGVMERVNMEERGTGSGAAARPGAPPPRIPPPAAAAPKGPAAPVNMQALGRAQQMMQNFGKVAMESGGLTVQAAPPGSMLASVGLQPGDVIQSVNGQVISSEAEIARIYQQNSGKASVQAQVLRNGQSIPLDIPLRR